jgi:putative membrane protein
MRHSFAAVGLAAGLLLGTGAPVFAQTGGAMQSKPANRSAMDAQFMVKAAQSDQTEIKTSELALERTSSEEVRKYAKEMIDEHTKSTGELKPLAERKGVTLTTELAPKQQALYDKLSKLKGEEFDREYMAGQIAAHTDTANLYRKQIRNGRDPQVKQFARKVLPTVEGHLKEARSMSSNMASNPMQNSRGAMDSGRPMNMDNRSTTDNNRPESNMGEASRNRVNDNINATPNNTPNTTQPPR